MLHPELRAELEKLGATLGTTKWPIQEGSTTVKIKGASNGYIFQPTLDVRNLETGHIDSWATALNRQLNNHPDVVEEDASFNPLMSLLSHVVRNDKKYTSPAGITKPIDVYMMQSLGYSLPSKIHHYVMITPKGKNSPSTRVNDDFAGDIQLHPETKVLIQEALDNKAPLEPVIDSLRERHPEAFEIGNEQYTRVYSKIIKGE